MHVDYERIKRRFGIIGRSAQLNRAVEVAYQVASTDLSVLVLGESGSGKEFFPQIVHQHSARKHGAYIAVNCGAIPEGTIDSELFGHVKGAFTGALDNRKGYFEEADGGTIFLDEVAELPLATQARLLRVLESGEFMSVGSSQVKRSDVRIIAATNVKLDRAMGEGRFREDLFYRLSTVPIYVPCLRDRGEDIAMLFRWFAQEFAQKYQMPVVQLDESARRELLDYPWPGNVRQLKNVTEQISVIEPQRMIDAQTLLKYLPPRPVRHLPALYHGKAQSNDENEVQLLYGLLFETRKELGELKQLVASLLQGVDPKTQHQLLLEHPGLGHMSEEGDHIQHMTPPERPERRERHTEDAQVVETSEEAEGHSLIALEEQAIRRALAKYNGHRRDAASELGISERTLYRKLKEYNIEGGRI